MILSRRSLLASLAALPVARIAHAYPAHDYAPSRWPDLRDASERVVVNFRAEWSITCQIKRDLLTQILATDPAYGRLTFVDVDWDTFGRSDWVQRQLKVERRSTLIAFQGRTELARLVNAPTERDILRFLDRAIA